MNVTRRNFLKTGAAAVAGFTIAPNIILGKSHGHMAPSDTPNIAAVGVGSQGGGDIQNIADPDEKIGRRPKDKGDNLFVLRHRLNHQAHE